MDRILFNNTELKAASEWHSGQYSMMYAIASTGSLSLGTHRPEPDMTDAEWLSRLASDLEDEAVGAAVDATSIKDARALYGIALKCRRAIIRLVK